LTSLIVWWLEMSQTLTLSSHWEAETSTGPAQQPTATPDTLFLGGIGSGVEWEENWGKRGI